MTVEHFFEVLKTIREVEAETSVQKSLTAIANSLSVLVSTPGVPAQQAALANGLSNLRQGVSLMAGQLTPSDVEAISAMAGSEYFAADLAERVDESVSSNAMTPSVAGDFVQKLVSRRQAFLSTVEHAVDHLEDLQVQRDSVAPGAADVAFLIPRDLFDNELSAFSRELKFIGRLFADYSEAITNERSDVSLETLSSSVPTIVLVAALPVLSKLGDVVTKFLDAWKRVEEIREVRARVVSLGMKGAALNEFTKQIKDTIEQVVEELTLPSERVAHKRTGFGISSGCG